MKKSTFTAWVMVIIIIVSVLLSGCAVSVAALVEDLGNENAERADKAVEELGKRGEEAASSVEEALKDRSSDVRINAARALFEIEGEVCAKSIVPLLDDRKDDVRAVAVRILKKTGALGVSEILAGAETYNSDNYIESSAKVISSMDEEGMAWLLEAFSALEQPETRLFAVEMVRAMGDSAYQYLFDAVKGLDIGDPLKMTAAEIFGGLGAEGYQVITAACDKADESQERQGIVELMLLLYSYSTDSFALSDMGTWFGRIEGFETMLLDAYMNADGDCKETILKSVSKITEGSNGWLTNRFIACYDTQTDDGKTAVIDLLSQSGTSAVKAVANSEDSALATELLQRMDKQTVVDGLTELLNSKDDFSTAADYIETLAYPEFAEGISKLSAEYADTISTTVLRPLLKAYAKDSKVDALIKTLCETDADLRSSIANSFNTEAYEPVLDITKTGDGDGKQDKIVILEYTYEDWATDAGYELNVSPLSFKLVPRAQQLSLADTEPADTVVLIKTKLVRKGTYEKKIKGYRTDYVIRLVDLRTNKVLGSKTLKGHKLPSRIYESEVYWSVKRYLSDPPSVDSVEKTITTLLNDHKG